MNLDDQIRRYFGASSLAEVAPEALAAGIEHMRVDLGLTKDRGERFALWALLYTLGAAPDLDVAFATEADREAARNFMDLVAGAGDESEIGEGPSTAFGGPPPPGKLGED
jgi:hypothetical protein